jgi:glyoxylase-like metal-dependent hydrolase (beta-lactamase superfamily II)
MVRCLATPRWSRRRWVKPEFHSIRYLCKQSKMSQPLVTCLFHKSTNTCNFIVRAPEAKECAIIDSVLDFSANDGKYWTEHIDKVEKYVKENKLEPQWILETHCHADHLSGAYFLKQRFPGNEMESLNSF